MQAQHLNTQVVGPEAKTIITLDMDLYMRALKLQSLKPHLKDKWILRIGEFHTVLCTLRAIGSSIENSGIDDAWVEAGLYSHSAEEDKTSCALRDNHTDAKVGRGMD